MAVIRLNPTTALAQLRQAGGDLKRVAGESGPLSSAPRLLDHLDQFETACLKPAIPIAVWLEDGTSPEEAAAWLLGGEPEGRTDGNGVARGEVGPKSVELFFSTVPGLRPSIDGNITPSLAAWLRHPTGGFDSPANLDQCDMLVTTTGVPACPAPVQVVVDRAAPPGVLSRLFTTPSAPGALDLLHADAAAATLERLTAIAGLAFEQEGRAIRAKRAIAQQRMTALQGRAAPATTSDLASGIRGILQRAFVEFARGLEDRFATSITANNAPVWRTIDDSLASIEGLAQEARVKSISLKLSPTDEEAWLQLVRTTLWQHCIADIAAVRDMLKGVARDAEKLVLDGGGPPVILQMQQLTDERLIRLVDHALVPQRKYQGELPQQGFIQYLMMARRYQTVAFMMLSAFGLSFVRSYREFMVPAAIVLLSLGGVQVVHSVKRERAETVSKELEKLRELLRTETRRMVTEVERGWLGLVNQHLSDQLPLVLAQVEVAAREYSARATSDSSDERQRVQRQLQNFEGAERKLANPEKAREGIAQAVAQLRGELRTLITAAVRGGTV